jgi:CHAT domain-containing protein
VEDNLPGFLQTSYALYQQLFPPELQQRLAALKPTTLYLVPTGALYELPFEALVTTAGKEQYLLHQYTVSYLSSLHYSKPYEAIPNLVTLPLHANRYSPLLTLFIQRPTAKN